MENKGKIIRLSIDVSEEIHKELKVAAVWRGLSIKRYVLEAVLKQLAQEKEQQ